MIYNKYFLRFCLLFAVLCYILLAGSIYGIGNAKLYLINSLEILITIGFAIVIFMLVDAFIYPCIDFMQEIKKGNRAVAIFTASLFLGTIIAIALMFVKKY